jgi:hypothetical protein
LAAVQLGSAISGGHPSELYSSPHHAGILFKAKLRPAFIIHKNRCLDTQSKVKIKEDVDLLTAGQNFHITFHN